MPGPLGRDLRNAPGVSAGTISERVAEICGYRDRLPGTDAERRLTNALKAELESGGRRCVIEPTWVHPQWPIVHFLHCLLAVAGSIVAASEPVVGIRAGPRRGHLGLPRPLGALVPAAAAAVPPRLPEPPRVAPGSCRRNVAPDPLRQRRRAPDRRRLHGPRGATVRAGGAAAAGRLLPDPDLVLVDRAPAASDRRPDGGTRSDLARLRPARSDPGPDRRLLRARRDRPLPRLAGRERERLRRRRGARDGPSARRRAAREPPRRGRCSAAAARRRCRASARSSGPTGASSTGPRPGSSRSSRSGAGSRASRSRAGSR